MTKYIDLADCDPELVVVEHGGATYGGTLEEFQTEMEELRRRAASGEVKVHTPIELRLVNRTGETEYAYTLWVDERGIIQHSLDNGRGGPSMSVSNLQLKEIVPKKAVPGWQEDAIAAAGSGLYTVEEVR